MQPTMEEGDSTNLRNTLARKNAAGKKDELVLPAALLPTYQTSLFETSTGGRGSQSQGRGGG